MWMEMTAQAGKLFWQVGGCRLPLLEVRVNVGGRLAGMVGTAGRCLLLIDLAARSFPFVVPNCQATSKLGSSPTIQVSSGSHATIQTNDFLSLI